MNLDDRLFPCPCCGYRVFRLMPGSHAICPVCGWEDNLVQLRFAQMPGGANSESLQTAQHNYAEFGASSRRARMNAASPAQGVERDEEWRPIDAERDNIEQPSRGVGYADSYPEADTTVLYYWRNTYWRRLVS